MLDLSEIFKFQNNEYNMQWSITVYCYILTTRNKGKQDILKVERNHS